MEVIDDPDMIQLLVHKASTSTIRLITPSLKKISSNKKALQSLCGVGVSIKTMDNPYIHAKLLIEDRSNAYIGSVNLTTQSMDSNRELGIIIHQGSIIENLEQDFTDDFGKAIVYCN